MKRTTRRYDAKKTKKKAKSECLSVLERNELLDRYREICASWDNDMLYLLNPFRVDLDMQDSNGESKRDHLLSSDGCLEIAEK